MSSDLKEPLADSVEVSGQKALPELLDQIEQRANVNLPHVWSAANGLAYGKAMQDSQADVAPLVRALRVAVDSLEIEMLDSPVQAVRTFAKSALQEVGQILREPADSVGQAQRLPYAPPVNPNSF